MTEANRKQQNGPQHPTDPKEESKRHKNKSYAERNAPMMPAGQRVKDVSSIELAGGKQVQRRGEKSHPGRATHWMKEQVFMGDARLQNSFENPFDQRLPEKHQGFILPGQHKLGLPDRRRESRNSHSEANQRAGERYIKQGAAIDDGRTNANEGAQRADQGRRGYEKRVTRVHAIVAAGEVMAKFVRKQDSQQRGGERNAEKKQARLDERAKVLDGKIFKSGRAAHRVGRSELSASGQGGKSGGKKERDGNQERTQ
jgi:hypothetical protein